MRNKHHFDVNDDDNKLNSVAWEAITFGDDWISLIVVARVRVSLTDEDINKNIRRWHFLCLVLAIDVSVVVAMCVYAYSRLFFSIRLSYVACATTSEKNSRQKKNWKRFGCKVKRSSVCVRVSGATAEQCGELSFNCVYDLFLFHELCNMSVNSFAFRFICRWKI